MQEQLSTHEADLAKWKLDLAAKMEQETKESQERLVESRIAYEREQGLLELLSKRRAEAMVAKAHEQQEASC